MANHNNNDDIWCCCCGDRTYYAILEEREDELTWYLKDEKRGIGICTACSEVVSQSELSLPDEEEDEEDEESDA